MNTERFNKLFELKELKLSDVVEAITDSECVLYQYNRQYYVEVIDIYFAEDDSIDIPNEIGNKIINDKDVITQELEHLIIYRYSGDGDGGTITDII